MSTILITGASSGIGLATAIELARRGARVFATMRDLSRSGPLMEAAAAVGVNVEVLQLDVTDPDSIQRAVAHIQTAADHIDVLVNNAGITTIGPLEFSTDAEVQAMFDTNVFGPLRLIRAVLPSMRERRAGRIVNLSSGASHARMGHRLMGLYSASKAAFTTLTEELLKEVAPFGIEVVLIDGALRASTTMTDSVRERVRRLGAEDSPYRLIERICQLQWPETPPAGALHTSVLAPAKLVADACLVDDPSFIFPPENQGWLEPALAMSDDRFVRLARLETTPELYEGAPVFWPANLAAVRERST